MPAGVAGGFGIIAANLERIALSVVRLLRLLTYLVGMKGLGMTDA